MPAPRSFVQVSWAVVQPLGLYGRHRLGVTSLSTRTRAAFPGRLALLLFAALFAGAAMASAARAAPLEPALTGTNPVSPGASITPYVRGIADGIIASVVSSGSGGPIAMAIDPTNTVTIYTDRDCAGPVAATGTAGDLEGAGIPVTVPPDSVTTFYATQSDISGESSCSDGLDYQQVTTPPAPPVFAGITPSSPANENFPLLSGSAAAGSVISIYADSACTGAALSSGTATAFSGAGIQVGVADNSVTDFYAIATLAGISSTCSTSTVSYQEVTPAGGPGGGGDEGGDGGGGVSPGEPAAPNPPGRPPAPKLTTVPGGTANFNTPLVTGRASGAATVKVFGAAGCRGPVLVKGSAGQFAAGLPVQVADDVTMTFYGVTVDGGGDQSVCSPDPAVYVEDSTAPRVRITAGPGVKTRRRTAIFRFTDATGGAGTNFICKLDRRKWRGCHAPLRLRKLGRKRHVLRVKASDGAGNRDRRGTKRRFKVIAR